MSTRAADPERSEAVGAPEDPAASLWYPVGAAQPPLGVAVRVVWDGRAPFIAARVAYPETRRPAWLTHDRGRAVLLPCRDRRPDDPHRPWAGWHTLRAEAPDAWQPQAPERWALPLPPPLPVRPAALAGRMWSATMRFAAVEEAAAAELAREMEYDRESARASGAGSGDGAAELPEPQWWLDPHAVTYTRPGGITPREAEGRLMRAFLTEWWVRIERPSDLTFGAILARLARTNPPTAAELAAADPRPFRPEPTGRDRDDMLVALAWLKALDARVSRRHGRGETVLRLRGGVPGRTWRSIGRTLGLSHEGARGLYGWALGEVTAAANGAATAGGTAVEATLVGLRAANRRHRLKETSG